MDDATRAQIHAARPDYSTWLTANAGAGKTRVLTNRVARLLLRGILPENILCLTYTTAAASEMQNRLFDTLGAWAMLDDVALREALSQLGEAQPGNLSKARTLFASAVEAPGGLKIQTIHSFCSRVLRQFPMEAGINPQFVEMDDAAQKQLTREVVTQIAERNPRLVQNVRTNYYGEDIVTLATMISKERQLFSCKRTQDEIFEALNVDAQTSLKEMVSDFVNQSDVDFLASLVPLLRLGSITDKKLADQLAALPQAPSTQLLNQLENCLLTKSKPFKLKQLATKGLSEDASFAPLLPRFIAIGQRVEAWRRKKIHFETAEATTAIHMFASSFLRNYQVAKSARSLVDFDDLIALTKKLLTTKSLEWVLYRLDARIDHILVDEAQDTSPLQWDVVEALSQEMISGEEDRERTLFVVGDRKQSIYSFQGADTENFNVRGQRLAAALAAGKGLARGELLHSFRSSPAILECVDAVFSEAGGVGESSEHKAFYNDMPGRVDLWPLVEEPEQTDELDWYDPSPRILQRDARAVLADQIADFIADLLRNGTLPDENGRGRAIEPGDIMILVQRRSPLFDSIISACKSKGLDVAGSDRLKIGSELAVRD
ncbi:MAG: UvrD-helicase domain-containing protein, partial [Pseudomonadota bacterium]